MEPIASNPLFTVALCTHNHADRLEKTLNQLQGIHPPSGGWEFLAVDNASTDRTAEILGAHGWRPPNIDIRVVVESALGVANARNRALREARGQYVVFLDDDETPAPDWLMAYETAISTDHPDAIGGRIEVIFEDGFRPKWLQDELLGFLGKLDHGEARWLTEDNTPIFTGNAGFSKRIVNVVGDFNATLGRKGSSNNGGEDTEMYRRLIHCGCRVRWVPDAVIYHRIQAPKLRRSYFLDLHFNQGRSEGRDESKRGKRFPPPYVFSLTARAAFKALRQRISKGSDQSLRSEMNLAYFIGKLMGWTFL